MDVVRKYPEQMIWNKRTWVSRRLYGNTEAAKAADVENEPELKQNFIEWVGENGIVHPLLQIAHFDGLRGIAAREELFPGQVINARVFSA